MLSMWATSLTLLTVSIHGVLSLPANGTAWDSDSRDIDILSRAVPAAPHFVIYGDAYDGNTGPPAVPEIQGFNVFVLSFLLQEGPWDKAEEWAALPASQRSSLKSQYEKAGIKLIVSLFGSTDAPTSTGADPVDTANTMAAFVKKYDLDGVDVDYEDFNAFDAGDGSSEEWLIKFTEQLRDQLPLENFILTHAPIAPWFSRDVWGGGGYLKVHNTVGHLIDWYNIQFYNQGKNEYTTCDSLLKTSSKRFPQSALFQIAANGVPLSKLVIGKPATSSDADSGFMSTSDLATCVQKAKDQGWDGGVSTWQFPHAGASWIAPVRSLSWPV